MLRSALGWLRRTARRAPAAPLDDAALLDRHVAGRRDTTLRAALVQALRSTRLRAFAQDARYPLLQRFLPTAFGDAALVLADFAAFVRLCELARRVGVQAECAARLLPLIDAVAARGEEWRAEALSLLDGAIDDAAFAALVGDEVRDDRTVAPLLAAIATGTVAPALFAAAEAELGVERLTETLRAHTDALAACDIAMAGWHHPTDPAGSLRLAVTLGDQAAIARYLPRVEDRAVEALGHRALGDTLPLETLYAELARDAEIRPLALPIGSLAGLFAAVVAQGDGPDAENGPLVSVVLTARDPDPALLALAIASILGQSHRAVELLLVDDASEDSAPLAAAAARDGRIRLLRSPRNMGPYVGRNRALAEARGEFIAIQDADDVSHPERIARQLRAFADPAVMACASRAMRFDAGGRLQIAHDGRIFGDGTMSTMFRRRVFDTLGPFAAVRSRGDVEYRERIRRTSGEAALAAIACPLVFCGSSPNSLSNLVQQASGRALRDLRRNFMLLEWRIEDGVGRPLGPLVVPQPLRP